MTQHKHAAVFEAAMQGDADSFEVKAMNWGNYDWKPAGSYLDVLYNIPETWQTRRKQKTHVVNGFTVPEPLKRMGESKSTYFVEDIEAEKLYYTQIFCSSNTDAHRVIRGIAHATEEGAIANCKARLGIDPYKDES